MRIVVKKHGPRLCSHCQGRRSAFLPSSEKSAGVVTRNAEGSVFNMPALSSCNKILKKWAEAAKVKPISFHTSRHTLATLALSSGVDLTLSRSYLPTQISGQHSGTPKWWMQQRQPQLTNSQHSEETMKKPGHLKRNSRTNPSVQRIG